MLLAALLIAMLAFAAQALRARRLLYSALWLAGASALLATIFYQLGAPEVAVIELSVGAGLVTVLFVFAINVAGEEAYVGPPLVPLRRPPEPGRIAPRSAGRRRWHGSGKRHRPVASLPAGCRRVGGRGRYERAARRRLLAGTGMHPRMQRLDPHVSARDAGYVSQGIARLRRSPDGLSTGGHRRGGDLSSPVRWTVERLGRRLTMVKERSG